MGVEVLNTQGQRSGSSLALDVAWHAPLYVECGCSFVTLARCGVGKALKVLRPQKSRPPSALQGFD